MLALNIPLIIVLALVGIGGALVIRRPFKVYWIVASVFVVGLLVVSGFGWLDLWVPIAVAVFWLVGLVLVLLAKAAAKIVLIAVSIVALLLGLSFGIPGFVQASATASDSSTSDSDSDELSEETRKAIAKMLTIKTTSADAECVTNEFGLVIPEVDALKKAPDLRKWSTAISTPFAATEAEAIRDELQDAICKDPLLAVSWLTFFAVEILDKTGIDIVAHNPWIKPYVTEPSAINDKAMEFTPLIDITAEAEATVPTNAEVDAMMKKNREWQKDASYVNTLFDRFVLTGIEAPPSIVNYHLKDGGPSVGSLPEVERNPVQEDLPALIFSLTAKDQCEELLTIGANIADKRPELFKAKTCEVAPPASVVPPANVTPPQVTPPGVTPPKDNPPKDNPPKDNPPKTTPKDPAKDPYPRGNAPDGGGKNVDSGPGTKTEPENTVQPPATPRPNPVTPAPVVPKPAPGPTPAPVPTPDPAPAPAPEPSVPSSPSAPEVGCVLLPGQTECP